MLNGKELISLGIKPGPDFATILEKSKSFQTKEEAIEFAKTFVRVVEKKIANKFVQEGSVFDFFLNEGRRLIPHFLEGTSSALSNSEIKRMIENKVVLINGINPPLNASIENQFPIWQLIFFPKSDRRRTTVINDKPDPVQWFDCEGNLIEAK